MNKSYLILFLSLFFYNSFGQGSPTCVDANPFCAGGSALTFPNTTTAPAPGGGINYGCLSSQPNPAWFYMKIAQGGTLNFQISQQNSSGTGIDVDFIAWGPFVSPSCGVTNLNSSTEIGCSYSAAAIENFTLSNAQAGQYYMIMITNFSNQAGSITVVQTDAGSPGAGSTNCEIVCPLSIAGGDVPICAQTNLAAVYVNSTTPIFQWYFNGTLISGATSQSYFPLLPGTYKVTASSPGCLANQSAETIIYDQTPAPIQPALNLTGCGTGTALFDLTSNTAVILSGLNPMDYEIAYHNSLSDAVNYVAPIANPNAYTGTNGEIIYASVIDYSSGGCITTTQFTLNIDCSLDTTQFNSIDLTYSPNPVVNVLDITSKELMRKVTVINTLGQIVYSNSFNNLNTQLDLSHLVSGNYFVKVESDNSQNILKIIKK